MRQQGRANRETRQQALMKQQLAIKETVNSAITERFVQPEASRRMLTHPHYTEFSAVLADVTSSVSREIAANPKRTRRPAPALTLSSSPQAASPQASRR